MKPSEISEMKQAGLDFNSLIYEGIPYVSKGQLANVRSKLISDSSGFKIDKRFDPNLPECIVYCNSKYEEIKAWLESGLIET